MFDEKFTLARNVVSLADIRAARAKSAAAPMRAKTCCHCGAMLGEADIEDECSSAGFGAFAVPARRAAE